MKKIGHRIAEHRIARGLSQFALAELAGVSPSTVAKLETHCYADMRLATLQKLCAALAIPPSVMIDDQPFA